MMSPAQRKTVQLADLTWREAEQVLTPDAVVMLPLGAAAKEHGPHLRLDNDFRLAEALAARVGDRVPVVIAPTVAYHYYPAFTSYPGSVSLGFDTARDLIVQIVEGLAAPGPRRFYVLNTGVSTRGPLKAAAECLASAGILLRFTDIETAGGAIERQLVEQQHGSHADEVETSMMLHLMPDRVALQEAVRNDAPRQGPGDFSRIPGQGGIYSPSGVWGDPTLATADKGAAIVAAVVATIVDDIQALRQLPVQVRR